MKHLGYRIILFGVLTGLWVLLASPLTTQEIGVGAGVALLLVLLPLPGATIYREFSLAPKKIAYGIVFAFVFFWAVIKSNLDVAFRVISPVLRINPGVVQVQTILKSRIGRLILANAITLTPGTITLDVDQEHFYIHWIDIQAADPEEATKKIVKDFEKYLEVIFG